MNGVMVVVGTRPEIIKMAPVIKLLQKSSLPYIFVHCGQHYDHEMSQKFIEELELPKPDYNCQVRSHFQGAQTARILTNMEKLLKKTRPALVLVEGDTNGVLATALASVKLKTPVGHVEAGLRSFDLRMPEEHNRRLTDHISTYLFAPTKVAERNLMEESVWGKIFVTGNTVIDAVMRYTAVAEKKSKILGTVRFQKFALATAHRAENVDNPQVLKNFMEAFMESPIPVVYPVHPRTEKRLKRNGLYSKVKKSKNLQILPPVGYLDFLVLMKKCEIILTDSGGIQEEATAPPIKKPVLVLRLSTERPEAVEAGFAKVVGVNKQNILKAIERTLNNRKELPQSSPYGDGNAAEKIVKIIENEIAAASSL
ncbi:MAG: UDP-N-acetylglucosamine 2-epimerase (non-hydrolyzing) [Candidatus Bathyarchaeia archaeon]